MIPSFQPNGLLPPGDYEVSFEELRQSVLADGPPATSDHSWDRRWRMRLIDNLENLSHQLWQVGIRDILDRWGNELEFPSAFRQSRRDGTPRGIIKIKYGGPS